MDTLLSHLGFQSFIAAEIFQPAESDAEARRQVHAVHGTRNESLSVPFERDDVNRLLDVFRINPFYSEELALIVWNDAVLGETGELAEQVEKELKCVITVYRAERLVRLVMPVLTDYSFIAVRDLFSRGTGRETMTLRDVFFMVIECIVRFDSRVLQAFTNLFSGRDDPEYRLVERIAGYLKVGSVETFHYPPVLLPEPPVNCIGELFDNPDGERGGSSLSEEVRDWFETGGKLEKGLPGYELRDEQVALSAEITGAFADSAFLLAEAGTGTGKSLAYLIPAYVFATGSGNAGENVVISTHTKNLQDQLFYKDLPLLQKLAKRPFRAALLKGRANYLCLHRWQQVLSEPAYHLSPAERDAVLPLLFWQMLTSTGDISECASAPEGFNRFIWDKLHSDRRFCMNQNCRFFDRCYVKKIREHAKKSHLTVINHSLLFSDINTDHSILGSYERLVIDEAHQLEKVAQQYLGIEFTLWGIKGFLGHLYERDRFETGLLIQLRAASKKAKLSSPQRKRMDELIDHATESCVQTWIQAQSWFQQATVMLSSGYREQGTKNNSYAGRKKVRYRGNQKSWQKLAETDEIWTEPAVRLLLSLKNIGALFQSAFMKEIDWQTDFPNQIKSRIEELEEFLANFRELMKADSEDFVYWYELPQSERSYDVRFYGVPLNIADRLREVLYERLRTCVFSSATLSVAGKFDYYSSRVGLNGEMSERVTSYAAGSPFDFRSQCRLLIPAFMPDPSDASFAESAAALIQKIAVTLRKGTLGLFTSYAMMKQCHEYLEQPLKEQGIALLMQGQDSSRTALTSRFRQDISSVLLGTDSFWEGVDVPGEALEILVITKLPFEVPSDPLVAAKMERVDKAGGNSFYDYSLPEAVIRFRQGFGRLIRHKNDRGVVLLLDNRLISKSYGKWFLKSLPVESTVVKQESKLIEDMRAFFRPDQTASH